MKMQMLVVRDIVANAVPFSPMFVHHIGSAIRDFGDQCQNPESPMGKHPTDYELYHLGEWDDVDMTLTMFDKPKQLAVGINYAKREPRPNHLS